MAEIIAKGGSLMKGLRIDSLLRGYLYIKNLIKLAKSMAVVALALNVERRAVR